jgi:hypothetical protein
MGAAQALSVEGASVFVALLMPAPNAASKNIHRECKTIFACERS